MMIWMFCSNTHTHTQKKNNHTALKIVNIGWSKKAPYFVFHPKVAFYNFFPYFSGGVDSRPGRFFWSIRYIVPAKIFPALPLCQKNWFCGKVRLDDFYPLLHSKSSSWIHIGVKRISHACYLHDLKNVEKNVKHNFGMKKKIGSFFGPPCNNGKSYFLL